MRLGIVGAGLSGLVVARTAASWVDSVTVFEASNRAGGQLYSEHAQGFVVEHGAEGFVAGSVVVPQLAEALGIAAELQDQRVNLSYGFDGSVLSPLAAGEAARFLGFQVKSDELGRGVRTFRSGMDQLTRALVANLSPRVGLNLEKRVSELTQHDEHSVLTLADGTRADFDAVVLATNAATASALLTPGFGDAARALSESQTLSSVTVSLAFSESALEQPTDASGFVVAVSAQRDGLRAASFSSSKFAERAPPRHTLVRLFFRPEAHELESLSDAEWSERARRGLERILPVHAAPLATWVSRWDRALPVSNPAHLDRVKRLEAALAGQNIWLAGSAFHGSGIDAAVRSANGTAEALRAAFA
ncbi:MAG: protoporphyrinogen/coproporphyrinogen oxidase [Myxococcota bacterium]